MNTFLHILKWIGALIMLAMLVMGSLGLYNMSNVEAHFPANADSLKQLTVTVQNVTVDKLGEHIVAEERPDHTYIVITAQKENLTSPELAVKKGDRVTLYVPPSDSSAGPHTIVFGLRLANGKYQVQPDEMLETSAIAQRAVKIVNSVMIGIPVLYFSVWVLLILAGRARKKTKNPNRGESA